MSISTFINSVFRCSLVFMHLPSSDSTSKPLTHEIGPAETQALKSAYLSKRKVWGFQLSPLFFFLQWKEHGLWNQTEMVRDSCNVLDRLYALFVRLEIPAFKVVLRVKGDDVYETTLSWSLSGA